MTDGTGRSKPRLLFLCQTLPYPPDGGPEVRAFNTLRLLARAFQISALCFYRRSGRPTDAEVRRGIEGLSPFAQTEAFPIPQEHSRVRLVTDHLKSVMTRQVYTHFVYDSKPFQRRLRELLAIHEFDLVHMDSLDLSRYLPLLQDLPVACGHHNVESDLLGQRSRASESWLASRYLALQGRLMAREERRWIGEVALNVGVSEQDTRRLAQISGGGRFMVFPNGVDTEKFEPIAGPEEGLVFVGGYDWHPNRDAMEYFVEGILPSIRNRHPDVPITWVGRAPGAAARKYQREHAIRLTGYVPDIRPYVGGAACYVVPLRVGAGSRTKILDAWAMGKAVVTTSVGCNGLDARDGENLLVRDEPGAFAEAVSAVLRNPDLRERLGSGGRRTAVDLYEWEVIGRDLLARYRSIVEPHGGRPST